MPHEPDVHFNWLPAGPHGPKLCGEASPDDECSCGCNPYGDLCEFYDKFLNEADRRARRTQKPRLIRE